MFNSNSNLNTEKINHTLVQISNFVANFAQSSFSADSFSIFLSCLRSSLAKNYEYCQFSYNEKESPEAYFFSLSTLRGITAILRTKFEQILRLKPLFNTPDNFKRR